MARSHRRGAGGAVRVLPGAGLPRADASRRRPRTPVPLHLRVVAEPRCAHQERPHRASGLRAPQGASDAAPDGARARHGADEPRADASAGGSHRREPLRPVPRHGRTRAPRLPPHAQRGHGRRGGRDREPDPGARAGAASAALRAAHPARDRRGDGRRHPRPAARRARHLRAGGLPPARTARSARPVRLLLPRPAGAEVPQARSRDGARAAPEGRGLEAREGRYLPGHPRRRRARAPPVRVVRDQCAGLPGAGGPRPARAGDQADAVPHQR